MDPMDNEDLDIFGGTGTVSNHPVESLLRTIISSDPDDDMTNLEGNEDDFVDLVGNNNMVLDTTTGFDIDSNIVFDSDLEDTVEMKESDVQEKVEEVQERITDNDLRDSDVVHQAGSKARVWPGNRDRNDNVRSKMHHFENATQKEKKALRQKILSATERDGGRNLAPHPDEEGIWVELNHQESHDKTGQAFRQALKETRFLKNASNNGCLVAEALLQIFELERANFEDKRDEDSKSRFRQAFAMMHKYRKDKKAFLSKYSQETIDHAILELFSVGGNNVP